ncbi:MAG: tRNA pseudouridine(55) synthase TruB [Bacillota bacterium]|jgi:tRNA pseudouridine55 synthase
MLHGFLIVNKGRGPTSHRVVAKLRQLTKQSRIGHTGTLDPEATGVLVVGLGEATRAMQFLDETGKQYRAEVILGQATDTQDATGRVVAENRDFELDAAQIAAAVHSLTGETLQVPPMYAAVKIKGQKLYELARQGLTVERQGRRITVTDWQVIHSQARYHFGDSFWNEITCSKGTYIRTLIHDLGLLLGCGAHMGQLIRLRSGKFTYAEALTLAEIEERGARARLAEMVIPLSRALDHLPELQPDAADLVKVGNGGKLSYSKYPVPLEPGSCIRVADASGRVVAIAGLREREGHFFWQPEKVFHFN